MPSDDRSLIDPSSSATPRSGALITAALSIVLVLSGCARREPLPSTAATSFAPMAELRVSGRQQRGASLAAAGRHVVATWTAGTDNQTDVYAAVSRDGGTTFTPPVRVNTVEGDARYSGEQAPRVVIGDDVVVVWQSTLEGQSAIRFARSQDGGTSFGPTASVHHDVRQGPRGWASLAADRNGRALVVWLDTAAQALSSSASEPEAHAGGHTHGHMTTPQNTVFATLPTGEPSTTSIVATNVCFCCKTAVAAGPDGAIYAAWRHIYPPNFRDISVARSTDGGVSFSPPARVSQDGWAIDGCPEDGPSMAVDDANILHITWPTIAPGTTDRKAIFYAHSSDGGRTFSARVRLDEGPADRRPAHPRLATTGRQVYVTWDEDRGRQRAVIVKAVSDAVGSVPVRQPPALVDVTALSSYPAIAATPEHILLAWTSTGPESAVHIARAPLPR